MNVILFIEIDTYGNYIWETIEALTDRILVESAVFEWYQEEKCPNTDLVFLDFEWISFEDRAAFNGQSLDILEGLVRDEGEQ